MALDGSNPEVPGGVSVLGVNGSKSLTTGECSICLESVARLSVLLLEALSMKAVVHIEQAPATPTTGALVEDSRMIHFSPLGDG